MSREKEVILFNIHSTKGLIVTGAVEEDLKKDSKNVCRARNVRKEAICTHMLTTPSVLVRKQNQRRNNAPHK